MKIFGKYFFAAKKKKKKSAEKKNSAVKKKKKICSKKKNFFRKKIEFPNKFYSNYVHSNVTEGKYRNSNYFSIFFIEDLTIISMLNPKHTQLVYHKS